MLRGEIPFMYCYLGKYLEKKLPDWKPIFRSDISIGMEKP